MRRLNSTNLKQGWLVVGFVLLNLLTSGSLHALEFRAIQAPKAILYDAPSDAAGKLFILPAGYPVEVIVNLGEWIKVRDHFGALSWVQGKQLTEKRTVLVVAEQAEIRQLDNEQAPLLAKAEKDVVLELLTPTAKNGWIKVKHKDGITGFMQTLAVWGL